MARIFKPRIATEEEIILLGFSPKSLACPCCGACRVDLSLLQRIRGFLDTMSWSPNRISSCCRCWSHHVAIYKRIYPEDWQKHIPYHSLHLITDVEGNELVAQAMDIISLENPRVGGWKGGYHYYPAGHVLHLDIGRERRW